MNKTSWTTVTVFGVTVAGIIVLLLSGNGNNELFTILVALLPSTLTTNWLAGRVAQQTSNGHVKDAVKQAITETDDVKNAMKQAIVETKVEGTDG